jgi:hypothetical protein
MKLTSTLDYHLQNPNESAEGYEKRKRLELGRELQPAKKIYLDTRFWVFPRDSVWKEEPMRTANSHHSSAVGHSQIHPTRCFSLISDC